jgi:riboflavin kinase/FMN adenylyltransferase
MKIVRTLAELNSISTSSIITIGNFDGVHCGHRMVIAAVIERARTVGARSIAVTFDPHPAHILRPESHLPLITPLPEKLDLLAATGLDLAVVLPFEELRMWTAQHFARHVLADALHAVEVHEGETFRFGHNAEAGTADLARLGRDLGFTVRAYDPYLLRGAPISSSRIRKLLTIGALPEARALLGRPFSVRSTPASGRGYGTLYTVPTINLAPYPELLPANGVYITILKVGTLNPQTSSSQTSPETQRTFRGVTNAGNRPTFGADSFAVETHLLDFEPVALTETTPLELTFLHRLRDEQRFPTPEALRSQIGQDVRKTQRYFALCDALAQQS